MITPTLVALCAPDVRNGKTTVADHLVNRYGYYKVNFKDALNLMLIVLMASFGIPSSEIDRYIRIDKSEIIPEIGCSYRRLATTLGTQWGRNTINQNLWVKAASVRIRQLLAEGKSVVIDDLRFISEYEELTDKFPVTIWRVKRPGHYPNPLIHKIRRWLHWIPVVGVHLSEGALNDVPVDATIINDGPTPEKMISRVEALLYDWDKEIRPTLEDWE